MSKFRVDLSKHCFIMYKSSVIMFKGDVDVSKQCLIMLKGSVVKM